MTAQPSPTALLLAVLRRDRALALHDRSADDWEALSAAAARHDVMPLVWHRLQEGGQLPLVPHAVRRRLEEAHTLGDLRAEARQEQLQEVLVTLATHGIPVVPLKGAFLAAHAYPSAALRPMGDLDLLVREHQIAPAMAALSRVGYPLPDEHEWHSFQAHRHPPPLRRPGRLLVELHSAIDPWVGPFTLRMRDVWARCRPAETQGACALALAPEDLLLHLATHMGRHHLLGSSLLRVCDVAVWVDRWGPTADWDAVVRRARESGARRFVYTALGLTHRLLDAAIPRDVLQALRDDADDGGVDDRVIDDAIALLETTPTLLSGALALTQSEQPAWHRLGRLARALVVPPSMVYGVVAGTQATDGIRSRREGYRRRWRTLARCLRHPSAARAAVRSIVQIRRLRRWANGTG